MSPTRPVAAPIVNPTSNVGPARTRTWTRKAPQAMTTAELWAEAQALLETIDARRYDWDAHARPEQREPTSYTNWLIMAGRGFGKTRTGAETTRARAMRRPGQLIAVIGRNHTDTRDVLFEHRYSGLRTVIPEADVATYNRSLGSTSMTLTNGTELRGYSAEQPDSMRGPAFDFVWCVAAGSRVTTADGDVPIEQVRPGQLAWTRQGWRPVTAAACTRRDAPVLVLTTDAGPLRVTAEHRVWVNGAWQRADTVRCGDTMLTWTPAPPAEQTNATPSRALPHGRSGTAPGGIATPATATTAIATAPSFTSPSGPPPTAPSPRATTCTTSTTTAPTTPWRTCEPFPPSITGASTRASAPTGGRTHATPAALTAPAPQPRRGPDAHPVPVPARSAGRRTTAPGSAPGSAPSPVGEQPPGAWQPSAVLRVEPDARRHDVYDLTIDGAHEFLADGHLVHNCDEFAAWPRQTAQAAYDMAWLCLREAADPAMLLTTTPQPLPHVRKLHDRARYDPAVVLTTGRTQDNAANLSAAALAELETMYGGSRLGRQELGGELLGDVEDAFVALSTIDAHRVAVGEVPQLALTVTAVDPATTSKTSSDETGIVTVGVDHAGEGYVVDDHSGRYTPDGWARAVWAAVAEHSSSLVVVEDNQGGEMVAHVLRTTWAAMAREARARAVILGGHVPIVTVHPTGAGQGKWERARPVAVLYEQGRIHHVVDPARTRTITHPSGDTEAVSRLRELEDQATTWTGRAGETSPDRVDAMVHGLRWLLFPGQRAQVGQRQVAATASHRWTRGARR